MFKFIRKKIVENIIKDIIKELPKYKVNALAYFEEHKQEIIEKLVTFIQKEVLKKVAIIVAIMLFGFMPVYAEETVQAEQEIVLDANKAVIAIQKQPMQENSKQTAEVKNNWFCIVIQCNGKVLDKTDNK